MTIKTWQIEWTLPGITTGNVVIGPNPGGPLIRVQTPASLMQFPANFVRVKSFSNWNYNSTSNNGQSGFFELVTNLPLERGVGVVSDSVHSLTRYADFMLFSTSQITTNAWSAMVEPSCWKALSGQLPYQLQLQFNVPTGWPLTNGGSVPFVGILTLEFSDQPFSIVQK